QLFQDVHGQHNDDRGRVVFQVAAKTLLADAHNVGEDNGGDGQGGGGHDVRGGRHEAGDEPGKVHGQDKDEEAADDPKVAAPFLAHRAFQQPVDELHQHFDDNLREIGRAHV